MEALRTRDVRRLALCRAGLLNPDWVGLPSRARGAGRAARAAALAVIQHIGYLQLDTISVAGARSHVIQVLSRLEGLAPALGEDLLRPKEPLFEYWGHAACWLPMDLYPAFAFRRTAYPANPWWAEVMGRHGKLASQLLRRIEQEGPVRSRDLEGSSRGGWWNLKASKAVLIALWSSGEIAIRRREKFQRVWDLAERVIPASVRAAPLERSDALRVLLLRALDGHGWATESTLARTWHLRGVRREIRTALEELQEAGVASRCEHKDDDGGTTTGWVTTRDLELAARLRRVRPRRDRAVLLTPFDPVLWDRARVQQLFGFEQVLEIYVPAAKRRFGYYCLPVLAGERIVGRVDLKAERKLGRLVVHARHLEDTKSSVDEVAVDSAVDRFAAALALEVVLRPAD